ncbi:zincin-like metallopeptidase domain-containing protein [Klebsiella oxytoca]
MGIRGDFKQESYIKSWLMVLKEDKKSIFQARRFTWQFF